MLSGRGPPVHSRRRAPEAYFCCNILGAPARQHLCHCHTHNPKSGLDQQRSSVARCAVRPGSPLSRLTARPSRVLLLEQHRIFWPLTYSPLSHPQLQDAAAPATLERCSPCCPAGVPPFTADGAHLKRTLLQQSGRACPQTCLPLSHPQSQTRAAPTALERCSLCCPAGVPPFTADGAPLKGAFTESIWARLPANMPATVTPTIPNQGWTSCTRALLAVLFGRGPPVHSRRRAPEAHFCCNILGAPARQHLRHCHTHNPKSGLDQQRSSVALCAVWQGSPRSQPAARP